MRALLRKIKQLLKDRKIRKIWYRGVSTIGAVVVFVTTYALVLPAITMESEASCGIPAHQHSSECYEERLICGKEESDGHHHTDDCYTTTKELICELPEHKHDESCYDKEGNLTCKLSEHTHKEGCYEDHKELTCTLQESDGHHHDSSCYEQVLTCGREAHIHSTECYKEESLAVAASTSATASTAATAVTASAGEEAVNDSTDAVNTTSASDSDGTTFEETELSSAASHQDENGSGDLSDAATDQDPDENAEPGEFAGISAPAGTDINIGSDNKAEDKTTENADKAEPADNAEITDAATTATTGVLPEPVEQEELSDGYVPTLDPINMEQVLDKHTGFYYYHADETTDSIDGKAPETLESSADITAWKKVNDDTKLAPTDLIKAYFAYTIPAGRLNETNQVARYRLPSNIHLTDDQIIAINQAVNGVAAAYVDQDTLQVADADNYNKYLGAEAVEGSRTPDETLVEGTQEYISAVVKAENVFENTLDKDGNYIDANGNNTDGPGEYLGQDLIFVFTPYSIEKNQITYDKDGNPTAAGEKITGWFACDFNTDQIDWVTTAEDADLDNSTIEKSAEIVFVQSDKENDVKEIRRSLSMVEKTVTEVSAERNSDIVDAKKDKETLDDKAETSEKGSSAGKDSVAAAASSTVADDTPVKTDSEEPEKYKSGRLITFGSDYTITLEYNADACIPENAELQVREITAETDSEAYETCLEQAKEQVATEEKDKKTTVDKNASRFFDIEIIAENNIGELEKIEPKAPVNVNIQLSSKAETTSAETESSDSTAKEDTISGDALKEDPTVLHFAEHGVETLDSTVNDGYREVDAQNADDNDVTKESSRDIQFEAESFSVYGVVYTTITKKYLSADGKTYNISVLYEEDAQIPENADLNVREIEVGSQEYLNYLKEAVKELDADSTRNISFARFFDIEIVDGNGDKIEPAAPVLVNIEYTDGAEIQAAKDVHVVHFADDGTEVLEGIGVSQDGTVMTYLQDGFSVTGTVVSNPAANDQYMVLIDYNGSYYIVNNDGTLTNVGSSASNTVNVDEPMMWTYDGRNIYHHSEQVSFNNSQLAADFYNKYIDPTDTVDGISKDQDNPGTTLRNINEQYFDWNTYRMRTFTYQVIQNRPQQNQTRITLAGDKLKSANSEQYLGVYEDEEGTLHLVGGVSEGKAAHVYLAQANQVLKTNYLNHTVNHIDISIEGDATVDVPLAYGIYYDANGKEIKEVTSPESLNLSSGVVGITMDDMKRAVITAYTKDADGKVTEIDNAFVVSGYSANESTAYSTQQVRIEGEFRTSTIAPVTKQYYDSHREQVWQDRLNHRIYYKVTAYKTLTFNLVDPEVGQLYDHDGKPLSVNVDVAFSASFDYWDQKNECPPVRWDQDWLSGKGTIPDHNLSGMDFVLGGNGEGSTKSRAVEIIKIVQDENGSPIQLKNNLPQSFELYRYDDVKNSASPGTADSLRNQDYIWGKPGGTYAGAEHYNTYDVTKDSRFTHVQNVGVRVGTSGVGQSYTYDYNSGMFYIKEDTSKIPDTIIDAHGDTWYYDATEIDTEYVRRYSVADPNGEKMVHTSEIYQDKSGEYASRAEVLGLYLPAQTQGGSEMSPSYTTDRKNNLPADNEFLEFTVRNVYKKTKAETTDLTVTKSWNGSPIPDDVDEIYVKVFRKADSSTEEDFTELIKNHRDDLAFYFDPDPVTRKYDHFDTEHGWLVIKKGTDGTWDTVKLKNVPRTTEDKEKTYQYSIREVGYRQNGTVYNNADVFNPEYQKKQTGDTDWTDIDDNGVILESKTEGENAFRVINEVKAPKKTTYTVKKEFSGGEENNYPTDGSVQVLVGLEEGYCTGTESYPSNWQDAGVDVITLPRPYSENPNAAETPSSDDLKNWFSSEAAWTYTWEDLNVVKKVNSAEVTIWYRAKEISTPGWFSVAYPQNYGQPAVEKKEDNAETLKTQQNTTITNSPQKYSLEFDKKWAKNGEETNDWPDNVKVKVNAVRYWHLTELDTSTDPATLKAGKVFYTDQPGDTFFPDSEGKYTKELSSATRTGTFEDLDAYAYVTIENNADGNKLIVAGKEAGINLEKGRTYLIAYTYGANESKIFWSAGDTTGSDMNLIVPGTQDENDATKYSSHIVNELTDLTVKKQWRSVDSDHADASWPQNAVVNYKIMRVPVYTTANGRKIEFNDANDVETYLDKTNAALSGKTYAALTESNFQTGVKYEDLPMMGVKHLDPGNSYGLVSGDYLVSYRYYVVEDKDGSVAPADSEYSYSAIEAQVFNGVATLTNEYKNITVTKKWIRNGEEEEFPDGFKVNWTVVQEDKNGNIIDSEFYKAYTVPEEGQTPDPNAPDHRLQKGSPSYTLKYLPATGVGNDGKQIEYIYEVVEEPNGSEAPANNPYLFRPIKAEEGQKENAGKFTIVNDLTKVTVRKEGDKGSKVDVQLYATTEKPSNLETVDVKITLDQWGKDSLGQDRARLESGEVTGTLTGSDGSSRTFTLKPGNNWTETFAGLPKYKKDGKTEIVYFISTDATYPVSGADPAQNATVVGDGKAKAPDYTVHFSAEGQANKVKYTFFKNGANWPNDNPGWYVRILVKDKSNQLIDSGELMWNPEWSTKVLDKGEYHFEYEFVDNEGRSHEGYTFVENIVSLSENETGEVTIPVGLNYTPPSAMLTFNTGTGWPTETNNDGDRDKWSVQVQVYDSTGTTKIEGKKINLRWNETPKSIELDPGTYMIKYSMAGNQATTNKDNYSILGETQFTVNVMAGDIENYYISVRNVNQIQVDFEVSWLDEGNIVYSGNIPNDTSFTVTLQNNYGSVVLGNGTWKKSLYLDKKNNQNQTIYYAVNNTVSDYDNSIIHQIFIDKLNFSEGDAINGVVTIPIRVSLQNSYINNKNQNSKTSSLRTSKKTMLLRTNGDEGEDEREDKTYVAPAETVNDEGNHEINVIDKSNLPEGAVAIGNTVTLNENDNNWQYTWKNLPKKDEDGNDLYYYVVEKRAYAEGNVSSTTATYDIDRDETTGEFVVTITNTQETEEPKTGTLVVEKNLVGLQKDDQEFKFTLQKSSGDYFKLQDGETTLGEWVTVENVFSIYHGQKYTFTNLPLGNYVLKEKTDGDNAKIVGYVLNTEESITGTAGAGISVIADGTSQFTFKNVYEPAPIRVTKEWQKADGTTMTVAPDGAKVTFHIEGSNGQTAEDIVLDGKADDKGEVEPWVAEWKNLPRQTEGETPADITYTVTEVGGGWEHYKVTTESGVTYIDGSANIITNKEEVTEISVTKQWTGADGNPVTDKESIGFTLYQKYTDNAGKTHSAVYTFARQKVHDSDSDPVSLENGKGTVAYMAGESGSANGAWQTIDISNLPRKTQGEDGKWYTASYYVVEDAYADVDVNYLLTEGESTGGSAKPEDAATQTGEITIVNTNESTSLKVEKDWDDLGPSTPYEITFTLQKKTTKGDWTDAYDYKMTFNGSTYTIVNLAEGSTEKYDSNVITNLDRGYAYRVVEKNYTVKPVNGPEIRKDLTGEQVLGSSETYDNGRTWTSRLHNELEKIGKIGGTKNWDDDKLSHPDPRLILERTTDNWATVEKVTALKMDPTVPVAAPIGEAVNEDSSEYTWLAPVWSTNSESKRREYSYEGLAKYSPEGLTYTYRVTEAPTPGYSPVYTPADGVANFNDQAATVDIENQPVGRLKVRKTWFAGATDDEMKTIQFVLESSTDPGEQTSWEPVKNASGFVGDGDTAVNTDENGIVILNPQEDKYLDGDGNPVTGVAKTWEWISGNLPRYKKIGDVYKPVFYRVRETKIGETVITATETGGWKITDPDPVELTVSSDKEVTINNDKDFISLSGTKTWVTNDLAKIPEGLELKLWRWTATWEEKQDASGNVTREYTDNNDKTDVTSLIGNTSAGSDLQQASLDWYNTDNGSKVWTYAFTNLPKNPANVSKTIYRYSVEEVMTGKTVHIDGENIALSDLFTGETIPGQVHENGSISDWNFINTEKTAIKIIKKWKVNGESVEGNPFDEDYTVKLEVFRRGGEGLVSTIGDFEMTKQSKEIDYVSDEESTMTGEGVSDWTLLISGLPKYYAGVDGNLEEYSYYVIERDTGTWHVEYSQEENGTYTVAPNQMDARTEDSPIYMENSTWALELPASGGPGTHLFYLFGGTLTVLALILLKFRKPVA